MKKQRIMCIFITCCILLCCISVSYAESPDDSGIRAELVSYDYSSVGGADAEGTGTTIWARIHVQTPVNNKWDNPQQYTQAMNITNVHAASPSDEEYVHAGYLFPAANAVPVNTDPDRVINSYDGWDEYWNRLYPDWTLASPYAPGEYWSQGLKAGETEWILKILLQDANKTDEDVRQFISTLTITCDIEADYCGLRLEGVAVENTQAARETRFSTDGIQFRADAFRINESFFSDETEKAAFVTAFAEENTEDPDQYKVVDIGISMLKQMPWAVCSVEAAIVPNDSVIAVLPDDYTRAQWKNGFFPLSDVSLLMKTGDLDEQQIRDVLKDLELCLLFSTEHAGKNRFDGTETTGYPGLRYAVQVNMQDILTMDEMTEKTGDISDG